MSCAWGSFAWGLFRSTYRVDFLSYYIGGLLIREGRADRLYDTTLMWKREREMLPDLPSVRTYIRPPFYAVLLAPLTILPPWPAFLVEMALFYSMLLACWAWAGFRFGPDAIIWSAIFFPAAIGTAYGQDCVLILVAALLAFIAIERKWLFVAGLVLGIALIKFHLIILFPLVLLMHRQWRVLAGLFVSACIAITLSVAFAGPSSIPNYIRMVQFISRDRLEQSPPSMLNIYAIPANFGLDSQVLNGFLALLVIALTVIAAYRAPLWRWFSAAAAGSLLIVPHCYLYDATYLLLPLWLVMFGSTDKLTRIATLVFAAPFLYFLVGTRPPYTAFPSLLVLTFLIALAVEGYRLNFLKARQPLTHLQTA
jgi:alpha-1,2-mannosyltransferase